MSLLSIASTSERVRKVVVSSATPTGYLVAYISSALAALAPWTGSSVIGSIASGVGIGTMFIWKLVTNGWSVYYQVCCKAARVVGVARWHHSRVEQAELLKKK